MKTPSNGQEAHIEGTGQTAEMMSLRTTICSHHLLKALTALDQFLCSVVVIGWPSSESLETGLPNWNLLLDSLLSWCTYIQKVRQYILNQGKRYNYSSADNESKVLKKI